MTSSAQVMSDTHLDRLRDDTHFEVRLRGQDLNFTATWGLFSPREIDSGTDLLLRYLDIQPDDHCFDLGCGYGPIGITMAKLAPQGTTLMADKDFMAIEYSRKNILRNNIHNAHVQLSNGFDHIDPERRFNIIASNIPAKVGKELLTLILHDGKQRLQTGGSFYVVTVNGLRQFMKRYMNDIFGNYQKLKQGKHHTAACAIKT